MIDRLWSVFETTPQTQFLLVAGALGLAVILADVAMRLHWRTR